MVLPGVPRVEWCSWCCLVFLVFPGIPRVAWCSSCCLVFLVLPGVPGVPIVARRSLFSQLLLLINNVMYVHVYNSYVFSCILNFV